MPGPTGNKIKHQSSEDLQEAAFQAEMEITLEASRVKAAQERHDREARAYDRALRNAARTSPPAPRVKAAPASCTQGGLINQTATAAPGSSTQGGPSTSSGATWAPS